MSARSATGAVDLARPFAFDAGRPEKIGIEVECALVRLPSGEAASYYGARGIESMLGEILTQANGEPVMEDGHLVAVDQPDGSQISLEPGGAIEYSSAPSECLAEVISAASDALRHVAQVARDFDMAVLAVGMLPFTPMSAIQWIPKRRVSVMREYFANLGHDGCMADGIMGMTTSTQTTLDYTTAEDFGAKVRMLVAASPFVGALFVNSPIEDCRVTGAASRRLQMWRNIAPARSGVLEFAVGRDLRVDDLIRWVAAQPMIYRSVDRHHVAAPPQSFSELMASGFGDGAGVTQEDWSSQLNQVWPHVRIRRNIEMRITDGPPWPHFGAIAALWTGLTYDGAARAAALDLVGHFTWAELEDVTDAIALSGLHAKVGSESVGEIARELVRLAGNGLAARVRAGLEPASISAVLEPVAEIAESERTFADMCVRSWRDELGESRERFVDRFMIR